MAALTRKWLPGASHDTESMAQALFLENDYWEKMTASISRGIAQAFKG